MRRCVWVSAVKMTHWLSWSEYNDLIKLLKSTVIHVSIFALPPAPIRAYSRTYPRSLSRLSALTPVSICTHSRVYPHLSTLTLAHFRFGYIWLLSFSRRYACILYVLYVRYLQYARYVRYMRYVRYVPGHVRTSVGVCRSAQKNRQEKNPIFYYNLFPFF